MKNTIDCQIYASTTCLCNHNYQETLEVYEAAGIERVELGYCPVPQLNMDSLVGDSSLEFVAHNYCLPTVDEFILNLASPDETIRERSIRYVCDAVAFCDGHDIPRYTFHAGFRVDPSLSLEFPTEDIPPYNECFERFVNSLRQILSHTSEYDVNLAIENNVVTSENVVEDTPVIMFCQPDEFDQLFDIVDSDRLGILLDTGHLNVSGTTLGYDQTKAIKTLSPYVSMLHLHWNDGQNDEHRPSKAGDTSIALFKRFSDCPTSIEATFRDVTSLRNHLHWLSEQR